MNYLQANEHTASSRRTADLVTSFMAKGSMGEHIVEGAQALQLGASLLPFHVRLLVQQSKHPTASYTDDSGTDGRSQLPGHSILGDVESKSSFIPDG